MFPELTAARLEIGPGAWHLRRYLSDAEQSAIAAQCLELGAREAGFYTPIVRGAHPMSVRMLCLGRHWNARTYTYEDLRSDVDGRPVPALPDGFRRHRRPRRPCRWLRLPPRPLHRQLVRRVEPDGAAPGQG